MTSPRLHSWPGRAALGRRPFRVASRDRPFLDLFSRGRACPSESRGFSAAQIEQIQRTVMGRTPEVMVKVTGGGRRVGAVAAHLSYISQHGRLDLETDDGQHVFREGQKELLRSWHLELTRGQYRQPHGESVAAAGVKLVHNVTLSMPAPTPPAAVLAAAKAIAREWRQDFARMMREQGIAANATPRSVRGQTKRAARDVFYRTQRRGHSYALREKLDGIVRELRATTPITDPARVRLLETRRAVVEGWNAVASKLEAQDEIVLGGHVRYFAMHLPPVLTDRERLAEQFIRFAKAQRSPRTQGDDRVRNRTLELTR